MSHELQMSTQKCVPIVMGGGMMRGDDDLKDATRIEYGSWTSEKVTAYIIIPHCIYSGMNYRLVLFLNSKCFQIERRP